jgi:hypothetical protein
VIAGGEQIAMLNKVASLQVDIQNFALVTHAVPAERVRRIVPDRFDLQTFDDEGVEKTLISANCFCNRQLHWYPFRYPAVDFDQLTFRTYVRYKGELAVYFFGTYVSTKSSFVAQSSVAAESYLADFDVHVDGGGEGYPFYACKAVTEKHGEVSFEVSATEAPKAKHPFASGAELAEFITYRLRGLAKSPLGFTTHGPIDHRHMDPWSGDLLRGRFDFWYDLGLLEPDEAMDAYSVLIEPNVRFSIFPPRPAT